ncbi:uncharacterized protein [Choristoneura fumiferana]|uniref:uncharacterized protein n=1 Tax=Choristoneura fumiferana TaxID=7141 RepID=UPI003D15E9D7
MAALRQEARTANLARWRKEREFNDLSVEAKTTARDLKRAEERLSTVTEARRTAERKATELKNELDALKPQYEEATKEAARVKELLEKLQKQHETAQAEVDRSRNDIRKLKSELQYSEKRRMHAEDQEEQSSRERGQLRDELTELRAHANELAQNNKALQEACSLLEEQLIDLEKLSDIHEIKNKDLETEVQRMRAELSCVAERLANAERAAAEQSAAAALAQHQHGAARDQARHSGAQLQRLRERLENREARVAELESVVASLEGSRSAAEAALGAAARRVRDLQEECAALRTRAHDHHAAALQLQAQLADKQEEVASAREAADAATAWWRTRETKADATLRQQAKLIDFLQAKVEEAGRKKCSLSNKLFGRSGRRPAASPPLRRANRELREEVDRLRAKLAASNAANSENFPPTPRREKPKPVVNSIKSIDTPDGAQDSSLQIVWKDGSRERMRARAADGALLLGAGEQLLRARLDAPAAPGLPHNEASRAFAISIESCGRGRSAAAAAVCSDMASRAAWLARLAPPPSAARPAGFAPDVLKQCPVMPVTALYFSNNSVAIGCSDGLHSLRGPVRLEAVGRGRRAWRRARCAGRARCWRRAARCGTAARLRSTPRSSERPTSSPASPSPRLSSRTTLRRIYLGQ